MFNRVDQEKKLESNFYTPIGEFSYEDLEQIVIMLNFLTSCQWVYERNEKDETKTHFKLGRGKLYLDNVATVSSQGAVIDVSGDTFRIFKINKALLEQSYCKSYQDFKYNKYLNNRFLMNVTDQYPSEVNPVAIECDHEPESGKSCSIM